MKENRCLLTAYLFLSYFGQLEPKILQKLSLMLTTNSIQLESEAYCNGKVFFYFRLCLFALNAINIMLLCLFKIYYNWNKIKVLYEEFQNLFNLDMSILV